VVRDAQIEQSNSQAQWRPSEQSWLHPANVVDDRRKRQMVEDVPFEVDAGGHLSELQTSCAQAKDASLRYIENILLGFCRFDSAESDRPDLGKPVTTVAGDATRSPSRIRATASSAEISSLWAQA